MKNSIASKNTFSPGDWVVAKLSFGARIIQMQVDGNFDGVAFLRRPTTADWNELETTIFLDGKKDFQGLRKDYQGDQSIFNR